MTRRWHVEIVVMVEADEPHADLRASDSANLLAQGVGGYVNVMREMSAPEPERMYTCPECSRTFDGPLAANVHEDATGHVPVGAATRRRCGMGEHRFRPKRVEDRSAAPQLREVTDDDVLLAVTAFNEWPERMLEYMRETPEMSLSDERAVALRRVLRQFRAALSLAVTPEGDPYSAAQFAYWLSEQYDEIQSENLPGALDGFLASRVGYCNRNVVWPRHAEAHVESDDCEGFRALTGPTSRAEGADAGDDVDPASQRRAESRSTPHALTQTTSQP